MEVSILGATIIFAAITWTGLVISVAMYLRVKGIREAIKIPGMPRIWFGSVITLKAWVAMFVGVAVASSLLGGIPHAVRGWLNLGISIMAATQAWGVVVAIWRDQRKGRAVRIPGRRPPKREGGGT